MHGISLVAGQKLPRFLSGKHTDRREHAGEARTKAQQGGLRSAPSRGIGGISIESVLHAIVVHRRKFYGHKLADALVDHVILKAIVRGGDIALHGGELVEDPAIERREVGIGDGVLGRVKVVQVAELIPQGIAQVSVRLGDLLDALVADGDVVSEILRGHPQPHDVRSVLADVRLASLRLGVAARALLALGNLFAIGIDHETMGEHRFKWRRAIAGER